MTLHLDAHVPKSGTKKLIIKSIGIGSIVFALFAVGFLVGNATATKTYAEGSKIESALLDKVQSTIDQKFVFWKSSSTLPTKKELEYGMIAGLVASYKDPYTVFFPPKEAKSFAENVKGAFGGVGMNVGMRDGNIVVIAPLKDSPAMIR
jgi:C-terminal processing protease CtpA/Prc